MSEDLNQKINQLSSILGQEKIPDNIKNLLTSLSTSNTSDTKDVNTKDIPSQTLSRVKTIMERIDASNRDERVVLLNAVKPFLNTARQKKLNSCVKILQMISLSTLLDDNQLTSS